MKKSNVIRANLPYFLFGAILAFGLAAFLRSPRAQDSSEDGRVKNVVDESVSGLKTPIPNVDELQAALSKREKSIREREEKILATENLLDEQKKEINEKLAELEKTLGDLNAKEKEDQIKSELILKKMVKTYESMSPKKAAGVIEMMRDDLAVELLMNMKEKKVASVLNVMNPERAVTLSSAMARRRPAATGLEGGEARR